MLEHVISQGLFELVNSFNFLILTGKEFHELAMTYEKDLCTHSKLKCGKANLVPVPLTLYLTIFNLKISSIYNGPKFFNAF